MGRIMIALVALLTVSAAVLTGCSSSPKPAGHTLNIYAAALLKHTFTDIGEQFKTDNPDTKIDVFTSGQADAGVVYPSAMLKSSGDGDLAQKFVAFVTGEGGQKILDNAGFAKP
jgi:ABC-type molybdate transport system substrate-binding protein